LKKIQTYENKKVLVLGLARSGEGAASLLNNLGAMVTVNDVLPMEENSDAQKLLTRGIRVIAGSHPIELMEEEFEFVVKNPGIPYNNPMLVRAQEKKIPIITEIELAYEVSEAPIIGITGTNGKTTTTTMVAKLLNANRKKGLALLSGNIGLPASSVVIEATSDDDLVMELSSFQLMGVNNFRPEIAVITNLYSAHLDYHGIREEYVSAKWKIQKKMEANNFLVINADQSELVELAKNSEATVIPFSTKRKVDGAYCLDNELFYKDECIMSVLELGIPGEHNVENALAAIVVAKLRNVNHKDIREILKQFHGVPHRMQFVAEVNGRKFYNDSKATNTLATKKALSGFCNAETILLAGGLDRGEDFTELIPCFSKLKALIVFGETAEKLKKIGIQAGIERIEVVENVEFAVSLAYDLSEFQDTILLSPANASWDQYKNFEVRGEKFMEAVRKL
jgi:UDP-N-acetylmuramoylalanine--D-glutamate ligase